MSELYWRSYSILLIVSLLSLSLLSHYEFIFSMEVSSDLFTIDGSIIPYRDILLLLLLLLSSLFLSLPFIILSLTIYLLPSLYPREIHLLSYLFLPYLFYILLWVAYKSLIIIFIDSITSLSDLLVYDPKLHDFLWEYLSVLFSLSLSLLILVIPSYLLFYPRLILPSLLLLSLIVSSGVDLIFFSLSSLLILLYLVRVFILYLPSRWMGK